MRYGSIDSIRVPFVEEAAKVFRRALKEERQLFDGQARNQPRQSTKSTANNPPRTNDEEFVLATILLAIKGDRTSVSLPFGIVRRRDVARALARIVADAKVDGCLVAAELLLLPRTPGSDDGGEGGVEGRRGLAEEDVRESFPGLVPLT